MFFLKQWVRKIAFAIVSQINILRVYRVTDVAFCVGHIQRRSDPPNRASAETTDHSPLSPRVLTTQMIGPQNADSSAMRQTVRQIS